jgi:hypothetical protein
LQGGWKIGLLFVNQDRVAETVDRADQVQGYDVTMFDRAPNPLLNRFAFGLEPTVLRRVDCGTVVLQKLTQTL